MNKKQRYTKNSYLHAKFSKLERETNSDKK